MKLTVLEHAEKQAIAQALFKHRWQKAITATYLGITRTTLWRKIKKYGIEVPAPNNNIEPAPRASDDECKELARVK